VLRADAGRRTAEMASRAATKSRVKSRVNWPLVAGLAFVGYGSAMVHAWDAGRTPLLDATPCEEAVYDAIEGKLPADAVQRMKQGEVVVVDNVLSPTELKQAQRDIAQMDRERRFQPNTHHVPGIRTDEICYIRESDVSGPKTGLRHVQRLIRGVPYELTRTGQWQEEPLVIAPWMQLARYEKDGGFYGPHTDAIEFLPVYWIAGPIALYSWLKSYAFRRRRITSIIYLNDPNWPEESGGALRAHHVNDDGYTDLLPKGGRLIMFDSRIVKHEVRPCHQARSALTAWICADL